MLQKNEKFFETKLSMRNLIKCLTSQQFPLKDIQVHFKVDQERIQRNGREEKKVDDEAQGFTYER